MTYEELKAEIEREEYAALSDSQIVEALNAKTIDTYVTMPVSEIKRYLFMNDLLLPMQAAASQGVPVAGIVMAALTSFENIETGDASVRVKLDAIMDDLISAALINSDHKQDIQQLAIKKISRAEQLGWVGDVTEADITAARSR